MKLIFHLGKTTNFEKNHTKKRKSAIKKILNTHKFSFPCLAKYETPISTKTEKTINPQNHFCNNSNRLKKNRPARKGTNIDKLLIKLNDYQEFSGFEELQSEGQGWPYSTSFPVYISLLLQSTPVMTN